MLNPLISPFYCYLRSFEIPLLGRAKLHMQKKSRGRRRDKVYGSDNLTSFQQATGNSRSPEIRSGNGGEGRWGRTPSREGKACLEFLPEIQGERSNATFFCATCVSLVSRWFGGQAVAVMKKRQASFSSSSSRLLLVWEAVGTRIVPACLLCPTWS